MNPPLKTRKRIRSSNLSSMNPVDWPWARLPEARLQFVISIKELKANIVLVPGDLSKDGENSSLELAARYLAQLKAAGKKVYVIPGNHDIKNGLSYSYVGDGKQRVPNITAEQFTQIYADYGYKDALQRDTDSISYVAEPQPGLWLLALDACLYKQNVEDKESVTDGKFSPHRPSHRDLGLNYTQPKAWPATPSAPRAALGSAPNLEPDAIRARVLDRVTRHRAGVAASDDLTVLILGREA